jgi:hypothetical protein
MERTSYPSKADMRLMSLDDVIDIRFWKTKGKNAGVAKDAKLDAERVLWDRIDEFDEIMLLKFITAWPHMMRVMPSKAANDKSLKSVVQLYNDLLSKLIDEKHPRRYRYIIPQLLDERNETTELYAWFNGNADQPVSCQGRILSLVKQAKTEMLAFLIGRLEDTSLAPNLLIRYQDLPFKTKVSALSTCNHYGFYHSGINLTMDENVLMAMKPNRNTLESIKNLIYCSDHHKVKGPAGVQQTAHIRFNFTREKLQQWLFPAITTHKDEVTRILELWSE